MLEHPVQKKTKEHPVGHVRPTHRHAAIGDLIVSESNMVDEYTLGLPLLTGVLIFISFFITWYRGVDPLVSLLIAFLLIPGAHKSHSIA